MESTDLVAFWGLKAKGTFFIAKPPAQVLTQKQADKYELPALSVGNLEILIVYH